MSMHDLAADDPATALSSLCRTSRAKPGAADKPLIHRGWLKTARNDRREIPTHTGHMPRRVRDLTRCPAAYAGGVPYMSCESEVEPERRNSRNFAVSW